MRPETSCAIVRILLPAYHDEELGVDDQVCVQSHLVSCDSCTAEAERLRLIGDALRQAASARVYRHASDLAGLQASVVGRLRAEQSQAFAVRLGRMFEDLHLVWAAVGSGLATTACVLITALILHLASATRPDSLAAVLSALADPGSDRNPVLIDDGLTLPRTSRADVMPAAVILNSEGDAVFALAATVTREGRVTNLELLRATEGSGGTGSLTEKQAIVDLMDALSRARFEPARYRNSPVAVSLVWLLAHTTVRVKPV